MAVYTGEFRDVESVATITVATIAAADDPALLERLKGALVTAGYAQQGDWQLLSLESPPAPPPVPPPPPPPSRPRWRVKSARNLRTGPDTYTAIVTALAVGAEGEELARQGDWWQMVFGPSVGWLYMGAGYGNTLEPVS